MISFLRWMLLNGSKAASLVPWALIKAASHVMFLTFPSKRRAPVDPSGVDDGRYDYGLSQPIYEVKFESKIMIPMRDGTKLVGDVFRPSSPGRYPVIMSEAPYPRYMNFQQGVDDNAGVGTKYQQFEQANPEYWVPRGYVYVTYNTRGFAGSEGQTSALDYQEFLDFYDAIEWAAEQPWSNSNIGLFGISYYAMSQYWVAGLHPPHLKAIVPWEGLADPYRDIAFRGGIPCFFSINFAAGSQIIANNLWTATDYFRMFFDHPLMDDFWEHGAHASSRPPGSTPSVLEALSEIDVPMLSVGNLNDPDLHLRGNVYAFRAAKSPRKKLLLYSGTHWGSSYQPWANRTVLRFFDYYLKGTDTSIESEPAVDVQLRTGSDTFTHVYGDTWPLEQTEWTKYYLDAEDKSLSMKDAEAESSAEAQWKSGAYGGSEQVTFLAEPLEEDIQVAGPLSAHLWVSTEGRDVDLTVELRDFDEKGEETCFAYVFAGMRDETVTRGWLRASMRALDPERSQPHQPFHLYTHNDWLAPGVPVPVDVEIWPTAMAFKAGHRIGLTVHCGPYKRKGEVMAVLKLRFLTKNIRVPMYRSNSPSSGTTRIHSGGKNSSWLELPVIPADPDPVHSIAIHDKEFTPALASGHMGERFEWTNADDDYHSVTESSGLGLWDSQIIRGIRSHNPETWWTKIPWAGTFNYRDQVSGFKGTIEIAMEVGEPSAKKKRLKIKSGAVPPPEGIGFDVQLQTGDGEWKTIHEGSRDFELAIESLSPGNYAARSRLRRIDGAGPPAESGWSPPVTFVVK